MCTYLAHGDNVHIARFVSLRNGLRFDQASFLWQTRGSVNVRFSHSASAYEYLGRIPV